MKDECQCINCSKEGYYTGYNYPECRCEHCSGGKMIPDPEWRCDPLKDHEDEHLDFIDGVENDATRVQEEIDLQQAVIDSLEDH
jgi:hypothetical protein